VPSVAIDTELDATARAVSTLRDMLVNRRLAPGQQLRQDSLAEQLGLSRSPLREALRILESEGFLWHQPNHGYFVTRLRSAEMHQIYLMRRLLETELLTSVRRPTPDEVRTLWQENELMRSSSAAGDLNSVLRGNLRFHFGIFSLSPLDMVARQVQRLWHLSEPYRSTYLWLPETQQRILTDHAAMISALAEGELDELVAIADRHRSAAQRSVVAFLRSEEGDKEP